jgi:hypothetical protein
MDVVVVYSVDVVVYMFELFCVSFATRDKSFSALFSCIKKTLLQIIPLQTVPNLFTNVDIIDSIKESAMRH